jgi:NAD(P)H-hydrate repair Nnr-like enzyme with NAD(P)H-hydrate epimerase domain
MSSSSQTTAQPWPVKSLSATEAADIDVILMSSGGFSIDQLMELAGLSVATATAEEYPVSRKNILSVFAVKTNMQMSL